MSGIWVKHLFEHLFANKSGMAEDQGHVYELPTLAFYELV